MVRCTHAPTLCRAEPKLPTCKHINVHIDDPPHFSPPQDLGGFIAVNVCVGSISLVLFFVVMANLRERGLL